MDLASSSLPSHRLLAFKILLPLGGGGGFLLLCLEIQTKDIAHSEIILADLYPFVLKS
jgi:hypothetical protein